MEIPGFKAFSSTLPFLGDPSPYTASFLWQRRAENITGLSKKWNEILTLALSQRNLQEYIYTYIHGILWKQELKHVNADATR